MISTFVDLLKTRFKARNKVPVADNSPNKAPGVVVAASVAQHLDDSADDRLVMDEEGRFLYDTTLRYPPYDTGIPSIAIDRVVRSQSAMVNKIKELCDSDETLLRIVDVVVQNYAAYVHLIPVTRSAHFHGPGGLFRFGLQVGYFSMRGKEGLIWTAQDLTYLRGSLEKKWSIAAFIAGLCSEVYLTVSNVIVLDAKDRQWHPFISTLDAWLSENGVERYFLRWLDQPVQRGTNNRTVSSFVISQIVPQDILDFLATDDRRIIIDMMACIMSPEGVGRTTLEGLINRTKFNVIEQDLKSQPSHFGKPTVGVHLHPYIIDAMRQLTRSGRWLVNADNRIWIADNGVWLIWTEGVAKEISSVLSDFPGIPQDSMTIADILVDGGAAEATPDGNPLWWIVINAEGEPRAAIRLSRPEVLFESINNVKLCRVDVIANSGADQSGLPEGLVVAGTLPISSSTRSSLTTLAPIKAPSSAGDSVSASASMQPLPFSQPREVVELVTPPVGSPAGEGSAQLKSRDVPELPAGLSGIGGASKYRDKHPAESVSPPRSEIASQSKPSRAVDGHRAQRPNPPSKPSNVDDDGVIADKIVAPAKSAVSLTPHPGDVAAARDLPAADAIASTAAPAHSEVVQPQRPVGDGGSPSISSKEAITSPRPERPPNRKPKPRNDDGTSLGVEQNKSNVGTYQHAQSQPKTAAPVPKDVPSIPTFGVEVLAPSSTSAETRFPPPPKSQRTPIDVQKAPQKPTNATPPGAQRRPIAIQPIPEKPSNPPSPVPRANNNTVNVQMLGGSFKMALVATLDALKTDAFTVIQHNGKYAVPVEAVPEGVSVSALAERLRSAGICGGASTLVGLQGRDYILFSVPPSSLEPILSRDR